MHRDLMIPFWMHETVWPRLQRCWAFPSQLLGTAEPSWDPGTLRKSPHLAGRLSLRSSKLKAIPGKVGLGAAALFAHFYFMQSEEEQTLPRMVPLEQRESCNSQDVPSGTRNDFPAHPSTFSVLKWKGTVAWGTWNGENSISKWPGTHGAVMEKHIMETGNKTKSHCRGIIGKGLVHSTQWEGESSPLKPCWGAEHTTTPSWAPYGT